MPFEEEKSPSERGELRAVRGSVPRQVWLVSVVIFFERAAYYGVTAPFQNYLQNPPHDSIRPGALGLGQSVATAASYAFLFLIYTTPMIGAVLADCWIGRYRMIQIGFSIYIVAISILVATAFSEDMYHTGGLPGFIVSVLLLGLGVGFTKPNLLAFMGDQYAEPENRVVKLKNGEEAITSHEVTIQFIYNVNYWMVNLGSLSGILTTFIEKSHGFGYAYLIPLCFISASVAVLLAGSASYVTQSPSGNILPKALMAMFKRKTSRAEVEAPEIGRQTTTPPSDSAHNPTPTELVAVLRSCLVLQVQHAPFSVLLLCGDLMGNNLITQAGQMQTHGLPNDIMMNLNSISVMILLPLIQGWIYPLFSKKRIPFSPISRISVGLLCSVLAIGYTTGIQALIYSSGPCFSEPLVCKVGVGPNHVNVGLQTPIYVFLALAEIFALVAGTELAYTQTPASMKAIVQAIFILFGAFGSLMGVGISFASKDPNMVVVYGSVAGLMLATAVAFTFSTTRLKN
ncbi:oligopeptide transporter [Lophiotrema nucula]|uniref:Oligopeptide transporter n=1 Tax=Lophiotrema nucula TaxID=690887 RepID=A0A6A5YKU4_9PLEO|nr:oligopeptide transporter [Lophiotrema nucula]